MPIKWRVKPRQRWSLNSQPKARVRINQEHWLYQAPFAHRGLHNDEGAPENTLAAFQLAVDHGYGIELDIQLCKDGEVVVFHDDDLDHLTNGTGYVKHTSLTELEKLKVEGSDEGIPSLKQTLSLIDGKVPVLVELKGLIGGSDELELATAKILDHYQGPYAMLAFNPHRLAWFAQNRPEVLRGQNTERYTELGLSCWRRFAYRHCLFNRVSKPDFVSYDIDMLPNWRMRQLKHKGMPLISWTINNQQRLSAARTHVDNIIFEQIDPYEQCD